MWNENWKKGEDYPKVTFYATHKWLITNK